MHEAHVEAPEIGTHFIKVADQPGCKVGDVFLEGVKTSKKGPQTVAVKTQRYTGRMEAAIGADGFAVYAWQDGGNGDDETIRAQNLNLDGTLGVSVDDEIFADGFDG